MQEDPDFLDAAFKCIGITDWGSYIKQDPRFMRPAEVDVLKGDSTQAKKVLGWECHVKFPGLVRRMVKNDIQLLK